MTDFAQNQPPYLATLLSQGCGHLPIFRELVADFETPLSCYAKVARGPYSYLLESANQGGEKWSRFSIIGLPARRILRMRGDRLTLTDNGALIRDEVIADPLAEIAQLQETYSYPSCPGMPNYTGGLVGISVMTPSATSSPKSKTVRPLMSWVLPILS